MVTECMNVTFHYFPKTVYNEIQLQLQRRTVTKGQCSNLYTTTSKKWCTLTIPFFRKNLEGSESMCIVNVTIPFAVDDMRVEFLTNKEHVVTQRGILRSFNRSSIYEDVIGTYSEDSCAVLSEYPLRVKFVGEPAVDIGGVCRDMFSCFWEAAYLKHFDGERLLIPVYRAGDNMSSLSVLGTIVSHGFLVSGFLPIRVAFPVLVQILLGPDVTVSDSIILDSFIDYINMYESSVLRTAVAEAKAGQALSEEVKGQVVNLLSLLQCPEVPNNKNINSLIIKYARHLFFRQTLGEVYKMHNAVPSPHKVFWKSLGVDKIHELYGAMNATPQSVLKLVDEPELCSQAESRVYNFLTTFISNCSNNNLRLLLRFITGTSVIINKAIKVSFNHLEGLARHPISRTCSCIIELSTTYSSYLDFEKELLAVLSSEAAFTMDSV